MRIVETVIVDLHKNLAAIKVSDWKVVPVEVSEAEISIVYEPGSHLSQTINRFNGRYSYFNESSMEEIWSAQCASDETLTWPKANF